MAGRVGLTPRLNRLGTRWPVSRCARGWPCEARVVVESPILAPCVSAGRCVNAISVVGESSAGTRVRYEVARRTVLPVRLANTGCLMNIPYGPNDLPDSDALDLQIDELCDEYEAAVRAGKPRRMEDYLTRVAASTQGRLLTELILGELEIRRGRGETPAMEEYVRQFPQYQTEIEEAFSQDNVEIAAKSPGGHLQATAG